MGHRRKAREYALQALYMYDTVQKSLEELVTLFWVDAPMTNEIKNFAISLVTNTITNIEKIDGYIMKYTKNWSFERIAAVDKAILRISICELMCYPDIPPAVTINEAIELGKIYGGENSGQFINGILDAVRREEIKKEV